MALRLIDIKPGGFVLFDGRWLYLNKQSMIFRRKFAALMQTMLFMEFLIRCHHGYVVGAN